MRLIENIRKSYITSAILTRILFVLTFSYANWFLLHGTVVAFFGSGFSSIAIAVVPITGLIVMLLLPLIVNILLNVCGIHSVPRSEYVMLTFLFFSVGNVLTGSLNFLTLAMPYAGNWILIISRFLGGTLAWILLYSTTSKLYFNDANRKYYFKTMAIVFFVMQIVGVIL